MAVLIETSVGDIVIDLLHDEFPLTSKNFIKLCKINYFNNCIFHKVQRNFIAQTGLYDNKNNIESSIFGIVYGEENMFFDDEISSKMRHNKSGTVSMASKAKNRNGSAFFITLPEFPLESLDHKHTQFGLVTEGFDTLERINGSATSSDWNVLETISIIRTFVIFDPFIDLPGMHYFFKKINSFVRNNCTDTIERFRSIRNLTSFSNKQEFKFRQEEAYSKKILLEMIGDLPNAEVKPPSNVIFVCKLNPLTSEEDLELIFSQCGKVRSCEIIRDRMSHERLGYGFISFDKDSSCELAFLKMNNVVIDDRRIKVDFSQSVANIWRLIRRPRKINESSGKI